MYLVFLFMSAAWQTKFKILVYVISGNNRYVVHIKTSILVVEITGMLYTRHHKWLTPDVIYLLHGRRRVTREKIALISPRKCPAWQPILNPVYLELEKLVICICGIAKFETGALYITYNYIINDSSRM